MRGRARGGGVGARAARVLRAPALAAALGLGADARAQVVLDGSLGPAGPVPFDGSTWLLTDDLGERSGANLFQSLLQNDVGLGETLRLQLLDPATPEPSFVFVRVTGGDGSDVLGRIESLHAGADLFLIDPRGFHFGPQSSLGALGSIYVSSADLVRFGDDEPFDARSSAPPAVLSADPPTAFGFLGGDPAGPIELDLDRPGTPFDFPVPPGETLALIGGDVRVLGPSAGTGGVPTIRFEGGSLEIVAVGSAAVDAPVDAATFDALGQPVGVLGEVELARNANLDSRVGAGRVVIRGGRLVVDDARITSIAGTDVAGSPVAVDLETSESVVIRGGSQLSVVSVDAPAGDLRFASDEVVIEGAGTLVTAAARGAGDAPGVRVEAGDFALRDGAQVLLRTTQPDPAATGGSFTAVAENALVAGGAVLLSQTEGEATGGAIAFDVGTLRVEGGGVVKSETTDTASGAGGSIEIDARTLQVETQGQIASENAGSGPGGAITVWADEQVALASRGKIASEATGAASNAGGNVRVESGGRILVVGEDSSDADVTQISALTSSSSPDGRGGNLTLSAPTIELRDGGQARTTTSGAAPGGSLEVVDTDLLSIVGNAVVDGELVGSGLFARVAPGASGAGGKLTIDARVVEVLDGGEVSTRTLGSGAAGKLLIRDAERVVVRGGPRGTSTLSTRGGLGAGGALEIDLAAVGGTLELASGGIVSASTAGSGDGGDLRVAAQRVIVSGAPSGLFSQSIQGSGAAGDVRVAVGSWLEVRDGGQISVSSLAGGSAGDVEITGGPGASVALVGGSVLARSVGSGAAGDVRIAIGGDFVAGAGAFVATDATDNDSGGGQVAVSAGGIFYLSDARIETRVETGAGNGGDVDVPAPGGAPPPPPPGLAVLNRSQIIATADDDDGGNIQVAASDLLASQGVVVDATSRRGVSGIVQVTGPDADLAGQIVPLPSNFFDAAKLMTTACDARRARTGSFVVQTRTGIGPLPDAPLTPSDLAPAGEAEAGDGGPADPSCPG